MWRGLALVAPALVAVASAAGPAAGPAPRVRACVTLSETWNGARSNHLPTSLFVEFARLPPASPHFQWAGAQAKGCHAETEGGDTENIEDVCDWVNLIWFTMFLTIVFSIAGSVMGCCVVCCGKGDDKEDSG